MICRKTALILAASPLTLALGGCTTQGYSVIAVTSTTIGVGLSQQPANGSLDATLGYKRAEVAFVPTNRSAGEAAGWTGGGARDSANVIMELRYSGPFSTSAEAGIYQRLAVGDIAVQQPGASFLFAKGPDGKVDAETAKAVATVQGIVAVKPDVESAKAVLTRKYLEFATKSDMTTTAKFDTAAGTFGYKNFAQFAGSGTVTVDQVKAVRALLEAGGVTF